MAEQLRNSKLANQIYLLINVLNTGFLVYFVARSFNLMDLVGVTRGWYLWIIIGFVGLLNILAVYARKNGGIVNPLRSNKKARMIHLASLAFFIAGIVLVSVMNFDRSFIYISVLGIPIDIYAIYIAQNESKVIQETDLIDDFEIDEN